MKTIVVCIAPSIKKLEETLNLVNHERVLFYENEFILCLCIDSKKIANVYVALDLIKFGYITSTKEKEIIRGKSNEFKINNVSISIRTGNEKDSFITFFDSRLKIQNEKNVSPY